MRPVSRLCRPHRCLPGVLLLTGSLLLAQPALANRCEEPTRIGPRSTDVISAIGSVANGVIDQAIAAAATEPDLLEAVALLQENQFNMLHPDAPEDYRQTAYYSTRCADRGRYQALEDAIAQRVLGARERYRQQGWYLGASQPLLTPGRTAEQKPGLLDLLLLANRYDEFETEARRFLTKAIGDGEAAGYFEAIGNMASKRQRWLQQWRNDYAAPYAEGGVGLLATELKGLETLDRIPERLEPLREPHIDHWLSAEADSYAKLRASLPEKQRLFDLNLGAQTSVEQLRIALGIAREEDRERIITRARSRGEDLLTRSRPALAVDYFELAGDTQRAARAQQAADDAAEARVAEVTRAAESLKGEVMKTEAEKASFEAETDALADELGIDLDDF